MDITVSTIAEVVVDALHQAAYAESAIGQYRKTIKALKLLAEKQEGFYTKELGVEFVAMTTSPKTGKFSKQRWFDYGRLIWLFDSFIDTGTIDLSVRRECKDTIFCSQEFSRSFTSWCAHMEQKGLAVATQSVYGRTAQGYLLHLEALGILSFDEADGSTVYSFLESLMSTWSKTSLYWILSSFRPFLKFVGRKDLLDAALSIKATRPNKIIEVINEDDQAAVIQACCNRSVSRRSAAITLLALTTGMRSCDIINLRLDNISWRSKCITTIQQKTGNPLTLPLLPALGNAISEYLLEERPDSEYDHVFIRSVAPFAPFVDHASVYEVIRKTFVAAGAGKTNCGTSALRHNAASKMLKAGVVQISLQRSEHFASSGVSNSV